MKTLLAASLTGLALLSGSALAADLPPAPQVYKAPPVMAPAYSWTGCYINGGFGYGVSNTDHWLESNPGLVPIDGRNTSGARGWLGIALKQELLHRFMDVHEAVVAERADDPVA